MTIRTATAIFIALLACVGAQGEEKKTVVIDNVILLGEFQNVGLAQASHDALAMPQTKWLKGKLYLYRTDGIAMCFNIAFGPGNLRADCILVRGKDIDNYWFIKGNNMIVFAVKQSMLGKRSVPEMIAFYSQSGFVPDSIAPIIGKRAGDLKTLGLENLD
jgi:hypothetical protein